MASPFERTPCLNANARYITCAYASPKPLVDIRPRKSLGRRHFSKRLVLD